MKFPLKIGAIADPAREWTIRKIAQGINGLASARDRAAAIDWLRRSREILSSPKSPAEKAIALNAALDASAVVRSLIGSVVSATRNYRNSNMPLGVKVALPATLVAAPFLGGQGVGIAALGTAIGAPALLLVFIGSAGVTSIIEAVVRSPDDRRHLAQVIAAILEEEAQRRLSAAMRKAMASEPVAPLRAKVPAEEAALRATLAAMDPFAFEAHVVSFFAEVGLEAWTTRKTNDYGIDGFAKTESGVIAIQCKRNALTNKVGGPTVREFKGALEESGAALGYIVTTSTFTPDALASAAMSQKLRLVDIDLLIGWHRFGLTLDI
ncbi:HJR/Mrr/RecB family endonuclease [Rhodoblastus acidophilus]|uniref:restriction endonuclease n=1 Tax=Rhodoblastus acidophilus TaxID=1074 RepID=UPI0022248F24|nr:restriction endonuclease [Rhodoblastus acidophilus]MCW2315287.1 HJR/Mrr/RecB family endonuclease [Rhodoblastus acidophilus]